MEENSTKTEVRFAVVMYGGVSLAIYMNGIAQELLRMVRATATKDANNTPLIDYRDLDHVEVVYRKLAYCSTSRLDEGSERKLLESNAPLHRKFVIDIISGTSAGGINGIFLAKALANRKNIDGLKNLWITEGDVSLLLNDKNSVKATNLKLQKEPASLFNSQRMYLKLFDAFNQMESGGDVKAAPDEYGSYVRELDLFVTATDILGLTLPMKLSDSTIYERKYKNVFRFTYSAATDQIWNDFIGSNNPMLAFAARSTSSFPFVFEPMCFSDIDAVLDSMKLGEKFYSANPYSDNPKWQRFFKNYPHTAVNGTIPYMSRPFGDGGYLDNKPFTYAIDTISERSSDYPIERKLLYIEPAPDNPELTVEKVGKPDAIENSLAALLKLPRAETIREDLDKIFERNRLTERVERIISNIERDQMALRGEYVSYRKWQPKNATEVPPLWTKSTLSDEEWDQLDLEDMTNRRGPGYVGYHRLEISVVTDDFGRLLTRVAGFNEESNYFLVFRYLLRAWRERRYTDYHEDDHKDVPPKQTLNAFLNAFDLTYPMRRLKFLIRQIDRLSCLDPKKYIEEIDNYSVWMAQVPGSVGLNRDNREDWIVQFRAELFQIRRELNRQLVLLVKAGRELRSRFTPGQVLPEAAKVSPIYDKLTELIECLVRGCEIHSRPQGSAVHSSPDASVPNPEKRFQTVLEYFFGRTADSDMTSAHSTVIDEQNGEEKARNILEGNEQLQALLDEISVIVKAELKRSISASDEACRKALTGECRAPAREVAQSILLAYYRKYSDFDMIIFPVIYGTGGGEGDWIDVSRVSPEDAKLLIDEQKMKLHKLAGTSLGNFGAFMEKRWRQNDIMWGQLDGAERIISALMPDREAAKSFTGEAQAAIVLETIAPMGREEKYDLLVEPFMRPDNGQPDPEVLTAFISALRQNAGDAVRTGRDTAYAFRTIDEGELRDHYLAKFRTNKGLEPEGALKNAARATTVMGKMLTGIADNKSLPGRTYIPLLTNSGRFFLGLVDAAIPRSFSNLIFRHWINLLYLFAVVMFVGGFVFVNDSVQRFAIFAFALTGSVHVIMLWLNSLILFRKSWTMLLKSMAFVLVVLMMISGFTFLYALLGFQDNLWAYFIGLHDWLNNDIWHRKPV
ncbi:patatin-like protein [Chlorobium sp. KB01]|uniref:patatin-like protein n=1 Tax=Chlorobium sp. KB01 TaxID=1917528 RepID=UPI00097683FE|nr:patatin-like protein [Chlorobium sp. KB01]